MFVIAVLHSEYSKKNKTNEQYFFIICEQSLLQNYDLPVDITEEA